MTEAAKTGLGLMAFWADIDPAHALGYQQWHNCEHIPERVMIPGFREGRRYRALSNEPHFLMMYETDTTNILASAAYLAALNKPTDWTREALTYFRNPVRSVYSLIGLAGRPGPFAAPYVTSLRFDLPEGENGLYQTGWLASIASITGVERVRLYRADDAVGKIETSERKIYGGGPGQQAYLALIEQSTAPSPTLGLGSTFPRTNEQYGTYWLEMAYRSPSPMIVET